MKFLSILMFFLFATGCSLSAPDGKKELEKDMLRDQKKEASHSENPLVGEPQFIKVRVYPKIKSGNVIGAHWLLMQVGRKDITFNDLLRRIEDDDQSSSK